MRRIESVIAAATLVALAALPPPGPAPAHDPGLSTMTLTMFADRADVRITLTRAEAATLATKGGNDVAIEVWVGGERLAPLRLRQGRDDAAEVDLVAGFRLPAAARRLRLVVPFLERLAHGHRQYVTVRDAGGTTVSTHLLSAAASGFEVALGR